MTTVWHCCNGSCRHMDDLRCTLDEITITNGGECKEYEYIGDDPTHYCTGDMDNHACGTPATMGTQSTTDWDDVTCPDCARVRP